MPAALDFYFEFASPYGYLASHRIDQVAARHGREVAWRPFMLGAVFKLVGTAPLTTYPLKGDYTKHDIERSARRMSVPFILPPEFPHATLAAARTFYWLVDDDATTAKAFARAFYAAYFGAGEDVSAADRTAAIAATLGLEAEAVLDAIQQQAIKQRLKEETEAAIARGVFGSPFIVVDGEAFWGSDRLDQVEQWLETGGW